MNRIICRLFIMLVLCLISALPSLAANTTLISQDGSKMSITLDGSTDWNGKTDGKMPNGRGLIAIKFFPSALNDVLVVRDTSATGPELFRAKDTAGGGLTDNSFGGLVCYPYIKPGDCTLGTPANARVMMLFIPTAI